MKKIKLILSFLTIFISFKTLSQDIENIYYNKFILIDKLSNEIVEVSEIQTTVSFNFNTNIINITSPILIERFKLNDAEKESNLFYLYITCIDHTIDIIMIASDDDNTLVLYNYDNDYYYVFERDY